MNTRGNFTLCKRTFSLFAFYQLKRSVSVFQIKTFIFKVMEGRRQNVVQRVRQFNKAGTLRGKMKRTKLGK